MSMNIAIMAMVSVVIEPVHAPRGTMVVELCSAGDYAVDQCTREQRVAADGGRVVISFPEVPQGRWGVRVLHDLNGNGVMDRRLGLFPREPFGFSRIQRFPASEPGFEAIAVDVGPDGATIRVGLLNQPRR